MKITVWKKYKLEYSNEEIEKMKKLYDNDNDSFWNYGDKSEFIKGIYDEIFDYEGDIIVNDNEGYSEFCEKWNKI